MNTLSGHTAIPQSLSATAPFAYPFRAHGKEPCRAASDKGSLVQRELAAVG